MTRLNKDNNAKRGSQYPGVLDTLNGMNVKLEEIQKSLDMYLETKRQIFPRFYFLSNDDLLEILGQSKNPEAVRVYDSLTPIRSQKFWDTSVKCFQVFLTKVVTYGAITL